MAKVLEGSKGTSLIGRNCKKRHFIYSYKILDKDFENIFYNKIITFLIFSKKMKLIIINNYSQQTNKPIQSYHEILPAVYR